ncbi:hypothetical protein GORHZ_119_00510 [Gordonia rhizosphera NBRC 16068]|uniref:Uncharacterized protein n=1 Tax=Gordonia rhizosphera NBRC 16068 TaxID=1108045 RepID=K6V481_9ACTN|nr:hypothetical protein GORHZ_119_00510 [Gordonia rhizosphera NBRC 16068]
MLIGSFGRVTPREWITDPFNVPARPDLSLTGTTGLASGTRRAAVTGSATVDGSSVGVTPTVCPSY